MKVYVSLPITGHNLEMVRRRASAVKDMIERRGHEAVTPFDVCAVPDMPYSFYMGKDIEALLECDAILRCSGWSNSKGCALESECAHIYNKTILDHVSQLGRVKD